MPRLVPQKTFVGLCFDTTGSTPVLTDRNGIPLALTPAFAGDPDAMFILWKDHTSVIEAEEINALATSWSENYIRYEGGIYSSEWVWSKVLHILRTNSAVAKAAWAWSEHCDWITGLITGNTSPETMKRSRCAAGHKAMWHASWGLPSETFLERLDPLLAAMRPHLFSKTDTSDTKAGTLTVEWAKRLGLTAGISVAVGAIDAHMGAVGAGIAPHVLTRIMGTSTCDIMVIDPVLLGDHCVSGICGQVDGSVLPGYIGIEAGQSAFGDIYAWFRECTGLASSEPLLSRNRGYRHRADPSTAYCRGGKKFPRAKAASSLWTGSTDDAPPLPTKRFAVLLLD